MPALHFSQEKCNLKCQQFIESKIWNDRCPIWLLVHKYIAYRVKQMGYNTSESAGKYFLLDLTTMKRMATRDLWKYTTPNDVNSI